MIVLVALSGCTGSIPGLSDDDSTDPVEYVPSGSEAVVHVDAAVMEDAETRTLFESMAEEDPSYGEDVEDAKSEFENETGLDPDGVSDVVMFSVEADADDLATSQDAFIAYTNWDEEDVVEVMEEDEGVTYEETERDGVTVYEPQFDENEFMWSEPQTFAVLESGTYVFGEANAVDGSVGVATGDDDGLDGEMRDTFDSLSGGYVTVVASMEGEEIPEEEGAQIDTSAFDDISVVGVSYGTGSGTVSVDATMRADSEDSAERVTDATDGAVSMVRGMAEDDGVRDELDNVEVEQNGNTVDVSYQGDVDTLVELIENIDENAPFEEPVDVGSASVVATAS